MRPIINTKSKFLISFQLVLRIGFRDTPYKMRNLRLTRAHSTFKLK